MTPLLKRLIDTKRLGEGDLNRAVRLATERGGTIPLNILRAGALDEDELIEFIVQEFDVPTVLQFEMEDIPPSVVDRVPRRMAETYRALPVTRSGRSLAVVLSDPTDARAIREIAAATGLEVEPRTAVESVISWALLKFYEVITPTHSPTEDRRPTRPAEQEALPLDRPVAEDAGGERLSFAVIRTDEEETGEPVMGEWDSPFMLNRAISKPPPAAPEPPPREPKPTRRDLPEAEPGEADDEALLLVDEDDWEEAGAALEDAIEAEAVTSEEPILREERSSRSPVVMTRNVILGGRTGADIIPPQPMTTKKSVAGIVQRGMGRPGPSGRPASPRATRRIKRLGRIDDVTLTSWKEGVERLDSRDSILDSTLSLMDRTFGPSIFLARRKNDLAGWNCSTSFWAGLSGGPHDIVVSPPAPREVWHALERKRGMMGPMAQRSEYAFLEPLIEDDRPSILILPVVIRGIAAGVFLCLLRDSWSASKPLKTALEAIGLVLSRQLEAILKKKKKKKHEDPR